MFRKSCMLAGGILVSFAIAGCDSGVKEGTVEFKPTNTSQFDAMKNQMLEGIKSKSYTQKPKAEAGESGSTETKK